MVPEQRGGGNQTAVKQIMDLSESEASVLEVVGIAGSSRVAHMGEFAFGAVCTEIEKFLGNGIIEDKVTVEESRMKTYQLKKMINGGERFD